MSLSRLMPQRWYVNGKGIEEDDDEKDGSESLMTLLMIMEKK